MARSASYGIGQYRYTKNYNYITLLNSLAEDDISYYKTSDSYQDIQVKLPFVNSDLLVKYGKTFYLKLTVPQSYDYTTTLNLKLCAGDPGVPDSIEVNRYQQIKQIIIPPVPRENANIMSPTLLFQDPRIQDEVIRVQLIDAEHDLSISNTNSQPTLNIGDAYKRTGGFYIYGRKKEDGINDIWIEIDKNTFYTLEQNWKKRDSASEATVTVGFVFSPKYNLSSGYGYLLIETDRTDSYHRTIQYIDATDDNTYYGTRLEKKNIKVELYSVSNLLERGSNGQSPIQTGDVNTLSHISIWGHPEQLLAINGEEIKIGQSGFYELTDFTINNLGVIVENPDVDRFIIDYEYKII